MNIYIIYITLVAEPLQASPQSRHRAIYVYIYIYIYI